MTTCEDCGYNAPHHGMSCTQGRRTYFCHTHAPADANRYDDAAVTCSACGIVGYSGYVRVSR